MILAYLILGHLLGDFIFQPSKLVQWKMRSKMGTFVHVLIHFSITTLILTPFLLSGYFWLIGVILFISFVHFWIDEAKISYDLRHDEKVRPFVVDQLLHLLTILIVHFFIGNMQFILPTNTFNQYYIDIRVINLISFLVFASAVIEIYRFQKMREKNKKAKLNLHPQEILKRVIIFTIIYAVFVSFGLYSYKFL